MNGVRILFVCRKFGGVAGGVERMAILLMNEMLARGHRVGLLTLDQPDAVAHYEMDPAVEWRKVDIGNPERRASWRERFLRQQEFRRFAKSFQADVVIGFQSGAFIAAKVATLGLGIPGIAAERNSPARFGHLRRGWLRRKIEQLTLLPAQRITIQLPGYDVEYPFFLRQRLAAIPNPVHQLSAPPYPNEAASLPSIVLCVGRLSFQKNQDLLIRAFLLLADRYPDWRLVFVGDGEMEAEFKTLAAPSGAAHPQIKFTGAVKDVSQYYANAAFLCLPSRWEGFPNVVVEAFAHGVPAVGLRRTAGANELIVDGETGLLSGETEEQLAETLELMMGDLDMRQRMGRAAARAVTAFEPAKIFDQWDELFRITAGQPLVHSTSDH